MNFGMNILNHLVLILKMSEMKKLILLFCCLIASLTAHAQNIMQFTGGNYIYAEQDKLIFNINPKIFENRKWRYDPASDSVIAEFDINLPLKIAHVSQWHQYQASNQQQNGFIMHAHFNHFASGGLYEHGQRGIEGGLQKPRFNGQSAASNSQVALPLIAGGLLWGARISGVVLRSFLPHFAVRCLQNTACRVSTGVVAGHIGVACLINKSHELPPSVCNRIEQAGYTRGEDGEYIRSTRYAVTNHLQQQYYYANTPEEGKQVFVNQFCAPLIGKRFSNPNQIYQSIAEVQMVESASKGSFHIACTLSVSNHGHTSINGQIRLDERTEKLTMIDLSNFINEDFKDNPTPYMNDKGEVGAGLRGAIRMGQADLRPGSGGSQNGGTFSLISSPYRNANGDTVQDRVTIGAPRPESHPKPSGNPSEQSGGISNTYNTVNIQTINRPDKEAESQTGENNSPNNGHASNGNSGASSNGQDEQGDICKSHPDSIACTKMGDIDEGQNPFNIPSVDDATTFKPDNFLPSNGVCPAPRQVQILGFTYEFSWYWLCEFASMIRAVVLIVASISAARIIFKGD